MEPNFHHTSGFSKAFADNSTRKYVFYWMLELSPLQKEF